jgi:S1-C subfamily serine protease
VRTWAKVIVGGALLALLAWPGGPAMAQDRAETVFRDARAYTVRIRTQITTPFANDVYGSFEGAGFLVDARRHWVLTNAHVVGQSPSTVQVAFADGTYRPARKVYVDSFSDVAVIEAADDGHRHPVGPISCDATPEIGESVGAFGHPLGMPFTGTRGIVSGKTDQFMQDMLQIDATVDHGNSGGPVISLRDGRIVGIATAGAGGDKSDRLNFATPMRDVCRILELLRAGVSPDPPRMEFSLLVDEDGRHTLQVGATHDPVRWPFQPGDRILAVGHEGEPIRTVSNLVTALRGRVGAVTIRVSRAGREIDVVATPSSRPSVLARQGVSIDGALIASFPFDDSKALAEPARLAVQSVEPGSAAEAQSIQRLDIIESIDGIQVEDLAALKQLLQQRLAGSPMRIIFRRMSPSLDRWFEYLVRDLPNAETRIIGPETQLLSKGP